MKVPHPFDQFPSIRAIGPDQAHSLSCWQGAHPTSAAPILCGGGGHDSNQLQAKRLAQNVPFAHQNLLASIIAAPTPTICSPDRLRVENRGRRRKLSTRSFANQLAQAVRDALLHAFPSWRIKYHCFRPWRITGVRQQALRAARAHDVKNCTKEFTSFITWRTTRGFSNQRSEPHPLGIVQVWWVCFSFTPTRVSNFLTAGRSTF